ncbi:unnamed protein product [Lampetra fluviatilis]
MTTNRCGVQKMALRLDCTSLFAQDRSLALHALTGTVADSALICMDTAAGGCAAPIQRRLRCAAPQSADEASAVTGTAARGVLWVPSARALARPRAVLEEPPHAALVPQDRRVPCVEVSHQALSKLNATWF